MKTSWINRANRLSALPPYVFARLDELKAKAREQGLDLIDLGMGNPDGFAPTPVIEAAKEALNVAKYHGYPPFEGTANFRNAIASWYQRRYQVELNPDSEALPLLGSKEGLSHLALAYVNPGDTVIVPSPSYPAHYRGPAIAGADIYALKLSAENDWLIDLTQIPEDIARKTKILYFNYPNNPTTATAPRAFFEEVVSWAKHYEVMLVHDLAYAELAFEGYEPTSLLQIKGAKEIGVEFHTLSKTYNMAGWRVGFVVGNSDIIQGLRTLKTNLDYGIFSVIQAAAQTALQLPDSYIHEVQQRYQKRRDFLIEGLNKMGWNVKPSSATMYLWIPVPRNSNSTDFALDLLQKTGVVVTPGNAFGDGGEGYVRVSLIADCDRLMEALQRWEKANIRY
ncbi:aspartate aminotransferase [Cyanobacterium aponinum AL20118]|uniref:LL-diaminopimelate aminotransferase apoenzyme n=3 Tax=Cyanobacterium aponinum TaxID=379064 RepID=K9Z6M0_CYAAP|nr:aspartate aminotransferase [Cyanobacterium aponinum]AFZ54195.1 LL-diaminopimelate aminotransferase apoenzyme [Cyanobacterium aponinum PCC 10605]MTF40378.1 aspartate aminotransferase [Cyanobacterium aponinum 0216]PHV61904.1 LL-diaminopimelate aminotransferase [Cyanobacterium aponinum IPPAS B-1201]WPF89139.1 aspartate aminotransferase [Cyanobacterium aponinum AL20115]